MGLEGGHERVADFVIGNDQLFLVREDLVLLLIARDDDLDAFLEVGLADAAAPGADGAEGG